MRAVVSQLEVEAEIRISHRMYTLISTSEMPERQMNSVQADKGRSECDEGKPVCPIGKEISSVRMRKQRRTYSVRAVLCLQVDLRVDARVIEDDGVGRSEIDALAARPRRDHIDEFAAWMDRSLGSRYRWGSVGAPVSSERDSLEAWDTSAAYRRRNGRAGRTKWKRQGLCAYILAVVGVELPHVKLAVDAVGLAVHAQVLCCKGTVHFSSVYLISDKHARTQVCRQAPTAGKERCAAIKKAA